MWNPLNFGGKIVFFWIRPRERLGKGKIKFEDLSQEKSHYKNNEHNYFFSKESKVKSENKKISSSIRHSYFKSQEYVCFKFIKFIFRITFFGT